MKWLGSRKRTRPRLSPTLPAAPTPPAAAPRARRPPPARTATT